LDVSSHQNGSLLMIDRVHLHIARTLRIQYPFEALAQPIRACKKWVIWSRGLGYLLFITRIRLFAGSGHGFSREDPGASGGGFGSLKRVKHTPNGASVCCLLRACKEVVDREIAVWDITKLEGYTEYREYIRI